MQGPPAVPISGVGVRPRSQQRPRHLNRRSLLRRFHRTMERRLAILVPRLQVRPGVHQQAHARRVPDEMQGRAAVPVSSVNICSPRQQRPSYLDSRLLLPRFHHAMERRLAIPAIDFRAHLHQGAESIDAAVRNSQVKRGVILIGFHAHATRRQPPHNVPVRRNCHQDWILLLNDGPKLRQSLHDGHIATTCSTT